MRFKTLEHAIAHFAAVTPDKVCLIEAETGKQCTYREFWKQILVFSSNLKACGLQKGDRAVVRVTQSIDTLIAAFGIHMAGGIYVPIAQKIGEQRILELLDHFDARFYISVSPVDCDCVYIDINTVKDAGDYEEDVTFPDPEDVSDIFFTTGTTGLPKGVMRSFGGYCAAAEQWSGVMEFTHDDVFMSRSSQNLVGGIHSLWRSFLVGAIYIICGGTFFLKNFFQAIDKYGVTAISLRPAELSMLLNAEDEIKRYRKKISVLILKSAATNIRDMQKIKKLLPDTRIFSNYSATEALSICSYEISACDIVPLCIGKPCKGTEVRIVDEDGKFIENSSYQNPGQIICRTTSVMKGYWKNSELTASVLKDLWLTLSDVGYMNDEGFVFLMGRRDDVINSGGYKIAPGEIEEITLEIDGVEECVCVPIPDAVMGSVPKLFVVMRKGSEFSAKKIFEHLALKLEAYKLPRTIENIDVLPRSEDNMKVKRRSLR